MPKYKEHTVHYLLGGYPFMMDDLPESLAAGSQQFAPKIGSASDYESDTLWSARLTQTWDGGIGKALREEGFYFSTADTLRADATLPPLRRSTLLPDYPVQPHLDTHPLAGRGHFAEFDGRLFLAQKRGLWEWNEGLQRFLYRFDTGIHATSMVYFDGYLHIAGRHGSVDGERDYMWVRPDSYSWGFESPEQFDSALLVHVFGGLLYVVVDNNVYYTAGSDDVGDYPEPPHEWSWAGPIRIGAYDDEITGIAGLFYQELGQRYVYVSTASTLNVILPGDIPIALTNWPTHEERNGVRMRSFYNKIFVPVGGDLFAIQSNGDILGSGIDNNEYGLPCSYQGDHHEIASAPNLPFVLIKSDEISTVWANKASGWHYVMSLPTANLTPTGMHYSATHKRLFVSTEEAVVAHAYLGNTTRDKRYDRNYRYAPSGVIDLGWYNGSLVEQQKYWYSVFCDAGNLNNSQKVEIIYLVDDQEYDLCAQDDYGNWIKAGYITSEQQEIVLGNCDVQGKRIRVAAVLHSNDSEQTPAIRAIGVRYTPRIVVRERFAMNISLPDECLRDMEGAEISGYNQREWNNFILDLKERTTPVDFVDLDGEAHKVILSSANRRTHEISCVDGVIRYWVDWSLSFTEAC